MTFTMIVDYGLFTHKIKTYQDLLKIDEYFDVAQSILLPNKFNSIRFFLIAIDLFTNKNFKKGSPFILQ